MKCHWFQQVVIGAGAVLLLLPLAGIFLENPLIRAGLILAAIPVGLLALAFPNGLIGCGFLSIFSENLMKREASVQI